MTTQAHVGAGTVDRHRPGFHFLPPKNWMNDPNGLIQWQGRLHLFYQYNPNGPFHGTIHWGHAVSDDLIHWTDLPIGLAPTPGGPDADGCWSGCAVDADGVPTLIYTAVHPQAVCLAVSQDNLLSWTKSPANPVIGGPPEEIAALANGQFRDPFVWRENNEWHLVIGSRLEGQGGVVLRYRSPNLIDWTYCGILYQGDAHQVEPFRLGTICECPNFIALDGHHLLIISAQPENGELWYPVAFTGTFDGERFSHGPGRILVHGDSFYAPQITRLADGRVIMFGWLKEEREQSETNKAGWSGVMSLPIVLSVLPDGRVGLEPVRELQHLRGTHWHHQDLTLGGGIVQWPEPIRGGRFEVEAVFRLNGPTIFGFSLGSGSAGLGEAHLIYDSDRRGFTLERPQDSPATAVAMPVEPDEEGRIHVRIFLDGSVVEVFANGHACLAGRVYPENPDGMDLSLIGRSGEVQLETLDIWRMTGIRE